MSAQQSGQCTQFKPHRLRPNKCEQCFQDAAGHPPSSNVASSSNSSNNNNTATVVSNYAQLSREQLLGELGKCQEASKRDQALIHDKNQRVQSYERELAKLRAELERARARQSETSSPTSSLTADGTSQASKCPACGADPEQLELALTRCRAVELERDEARDELQSLEREMDEMHDNFREDESEQFEQLKQELDTVTKNCKILQIRLAKSERQYSQLEQVKRMLEQQLADQLGGSDSTSQRAAMGPNEFNLTHSYTPTRLASSKSTAEQDELLRDLSDALERERDLQEQIRYSREEAQLKGDRLMTVEAENEVLLGKVTKLTLANSRLRAAAVGTTAQQNSKSSGGDLTTSGLDQAAQTEELCRRELAEYIQQNEQLKLALDVARTDCDRVRTSLREAQGQVEVKEALLRDASDKCTKMASELSRRAQVTNESNGAQSEDNRLAQADAECRQLRNRLVQSERDCIQLREQLGPQQNNATKQSGSPTAENAKLRLANQQLTDKCSLLQAQHDSLMRKLEDVNNQQALRENQQSPLQASQMESDLLSKLKRQLDVSESELAKARSRLVELDVELSRSQRQHKQLLESLEPPQQSTESGSQHYRRKYRLPDEAARQSMTRPELRQAITSLNEEIESWLTLLWSKDCLIRSMKDSQEASGTGSSTGELASPTNEEQQIRSLHRLLDQERLLSSSLKLDVSKLEQARQELAKTVNMLERERVSMDDELEKLRQLNQELTLDLEEAKRGQANLVVRTRELQFNSDKLRSELEALKSSTPSAGNGVPANNGSSSHTSGHQQSQELLLMGRDLSELKVKNGFLMRQLELARDDTGRQLEEARQAADAQLKRAVELAQIELKERHLSESQVLRDEANVLRQKLAEAQRAASRHEENTATERDRIRSLERDWRREKSQWQQRLEQLEAQLTIERRSSEFKLKEAESGVRDKERELINVQDKYVQLERDLKRLQNKHQLLEDTGEARLKTVSRELEAKRRELAELSAVSQAKESEQYESLKRLNSEKSMLADAFESIKRSYDEKLAQLKTCRELLSQRQDQAYRERQSYQDKLDELSQQLARASEHEARARMVRMQAETLEKQLEQARRDSAQLKEDRQRTKTKCEELERRCARYEKQELLNKTTSLAPVRLGALSGGTTTTSTTTTARSMSGSSAGRKSPMGPETEQAQLNDSGATIERLSGKISDQRHLINMLKQQLAEAQLELKQVRLLQTADRASCHSELAQLRGRLNEAEERLLFESSLALGDEAFETGRKRLKAKWAQERESLVSTLQQQQAQIEQLVKDLKKLAQAHDMLRLQSRQVEAHNGKLSRKLIEYQQQQAMALQDQLAWPGSRRSGSQAGELARLEAQNARLLTLVRDQTQPVVELVAKVVNAFDERSAAATAATAAASGAGNGAQTASSATTGTSSGIGSTRANSSSDESRVASLSTMRPLLARPQRRGSQASAEDADSLPDPDSISSARPAYQVAASHHQAGSRLSRMLRGRQPSPAPTELPASTKPTTKTVRVRTKAAALGLSLVERRQLKKRFETLTLELNKLQSDGLLSGQTAASTTQDSNIGASTGPRSSLLAAIPQASDRADRSSSHSRPSTSDQVTGSPSRVRWQTDSDLDSERSWSSQPMATGDSYRRFPQSTASRTHNAAGASLTDYDSEASIASDMSSSFSVTQRSRFASGAESDSCVGQAGQTKLKKRGLKTRLTKTLRNISRSITGLTSDSDSEQPPTQTRQGLCEIRV